MYFVFKTVGNGHSDIYNILNNEEDVKKVGDDYPSCQLFRLHVDLDMLALTVNKFRFIEMLD